MCATSQVGDNFGAGYWPNKYPSLTFPYTGGGTPPSYPSGGGSIAPEPVSRLEFERLVVEVQALRLLLLAARAFDESTGQPECEVEDKVAVLKAVAEMVGVDLSDVFG